MSRFRRAASKGARSERVPRSHARLNPVMACDTAFRLVTRRCLADLTANHATTCRGDPEALHQMRVALARLRTAISFFSSMAADHQRKPIKAELKWLHHELGAVRDLDVATGRLEAGGKLQPRDYRSWKAKQVAGHRRLARTLRSARYRRLIKSTSGWIASGPWSTTTAKHASRKRASSIAMYSSYKLMRWRKRLLKKSLKLRDMSAKARHRLRLMSKKSYYSTEFFEDLFRNAELARQRTALKYLRQVQRSLGQLNDDARGRSLAAALRQHGARAPQQFTSRKRKKRLIRSAVAAYRKLAALKPLRT
jgi:CHAD domain-containing protein